MRTEIQKQSGESKQNLKEQSSGAFFSTTFIKTQLSHISWWDEWEKKKKTFLLTLEKLR